MAFQSERRLLPDLSIALLPLALIIAVGLMLRWYQLDLRPVHHDESQHAYFAWRYWKDPVRHFYTYNPVLHGPFLFHYLRLSFALLGDSLWTVRAAASLIGTLVLFLPFLFRRQMSFSLTLAITGFVALSPTFVYWSRFARNDLAVLLWFYLAVAIITLASRRVRCLFILPLISLQFCTKETVFVLLSIISGYILFEAILLKIISGASSSFAAIRRDLVECRDILFLGFGISVFIYTYFFTAGGKTIKGMLEGPFTSGFTYWLSAHQHDRLTGPFLYYVLLLLLYELPFLLLVIWQICHFIRRAARSIKLAALLLLLCSVCVWILAINFSLEQSAPFKFFHLKSSIDALAAVLIAGLSVIIPLQHLKRAQRALAFWGYFFWATLFSYSMLGEKVPWLLLYPLSAGLTYQVLYWKEHLPFGRPLLPLLFIIPSMLLMTWSSILSNFLKAGSASELIGQVHATPEYHSLMQEVRSQAEMARAPGKFVVDKDLRWPTTWYLRGHKIIGPEKAEGKSIAIKIVNKPDPADRNVHKRSIPYRSAWVPVRKGFTILGLFRYIFLHEPWNRVRVKYVVVVDRRERAGEN